jgi:hypothetical protein
MSNHAWIISTGTYTHIDLAGIGIKAQPKRIVEYKLSDMGRYLISSDPVSVENRLMGCECHFKPGAWQRIRMAAARRIPFADKGENRSRAGERQLLMARQYVRMPALRDRDLADHIDHLRSQLRTLDPVVQEIAALDLDHLLDIRGVCEDEGGHRTHINLNGDLETKRRYVLDNLLCSVPITLQHARIAEGLYEMRGLAPEGYRAERHHRLLKFHVEGRFFACLLNAAGKVAFWIDNVKPLHHLLLLQQTLETNPAFKSSLECCLEGDGRALRLMLNAEMEIDYSRNRLPRIYQELFHDLSLDTVRQKEVIRSLNTHQMGVSFSYVPPESFGDPRPVTSISVMHDVKALDPLRKRVPRLYAEISRKATLSEAGKYYLLESIKGRPDEDGLQSQ